MQADEQNLVELYKAMSVENLEYQRENMKVDLFTVVGTAFFYSWLFQRSGSAGQESWLALVGPLFILVCWFRGSCIAVAMANVDP